MLSQNEAALTSLTPPQLRACEAERFLQLYLESCAPPHDSYFDMICHSDAFLFTLISVEEMVDSQCHGRIGGIPVFRFLKALRNITTHHSVLASAAPDSKYPRPFSRLITDGDRGIASARLFFNFPVLREVLDALELERPWEKKYFDCAREYISGLEASNSRVFLESPFAEGLSAVRGVL